MRAYPVVRPWRDTYAPLILVQRALAPHDARVLRVSVRVPDGAPAAEALVRYLGAGTLLDATLAREVVSAEIPDEVSARSASTLHVVVKNTGTWTWSPSDVLPVHAGVSVVGVGTDTKPEESATPAEPVRVSLASAVAPGETVALAIPVRWPDAPGEARVRVDLVLEEVAWFADRNGGVPLVDRRVRVVPR